MRWIGGLTGKYVQTCAGYGVDLDSVLLLTSTTRLSFQAQYLHSRYDDFVYLTLGPPAAPRTTCLVSAGSPPNAAVNCSSQPTLRSPTWTLVGNVEQGLPLGNGGRLVGGANIRYESHYQTDASYLPEAIANATTRLYLTFGYEAPDDTWSLKAYVDNVTDATSITATTQSTSYAANQAFGVRLLPPRTYGVRGRVKFR